jgi:fructokinase
MEANPIILAAVEGGGTSFRVAVCRVPHEHTKDSGTASPWPEILARTEIDSSHDHPLVTLRACVDFFEAYKPVGGYHALGIACFGPLGVNVARVEDYGRILATSPKAAWRGVDLLTPLATCCRGDTHALVTRVDTDVNAPALAEYYLATQRVKHPGAVAYPVDDAVTSASSEISSIAYVTVGTGVGVGLVVHGQPVHGRMHPEGGHVAVQPLANDVFPGYSWGQKNCPYEGVHTVEGLASSVALTERLAQRQQSPTPLSRSVLASLPDDHEVWDHAVNALANLCVTLLLTLSMEKIVMGGGILRRASLLPRIQARTVELLNGYLPLPEDMSTLIATSSFGDDIGLIGAMVLAQSSLQLNEHTRESRKRHETLMKQTAFKHGLWHGMLVGAVGAALVCKYVWYGPRTRK